MINTKKLIKMARKWQRVAALKRKRIAPPISREDATQISKNETTMADKGHFVVYTVDQRRFIFPIAYLNNSIIRELFRMSEEEFGLPSDGPITLPCDAVFMEYVVSLIQRRVDRNFEKALLASIGSNSCALSCSLHQGQSGQQLLVY